MVFQRGMAKYILRPLLEEDQMKLLTESINQVVERIAQETSPFVALEWTCKVLLRIFNSKDAVNYVMLPKL